MTPESVASCPRCRCLVLAPRPWLVLDPGGLSRLAIADLVVDALAGDDGWEGQPFAYPGGEVHECPPPEADPRALDALRGVLRPDLDARGHDGAQTLHGPYRPDYGKGGPTWN